MFTKLQNTVTVDISCYCSKFSITDIKIADHLSNIQGVYYLRSINSQGGIDIFLVFLIINSSDCDIYPVNKHCDITISQRI